MGKAPSRVPTCAQWGKLEKVQSSSSIIALLPFIKHACVWDPSEATKLHLWCLLSILYSLPGLEVLDGVQVRDYHPSSIWRWARVSILVDVHEKDQDFNAISRLEHGKASAHDHKQQGRSTFRVFNLLVFPRRDNEPPCWTRQWKAHGKVCQHRLASGDERDEHKNV